MTMLKRIITAVAMALALATPVVAVASPANAAARDGVCESGEFCYYYNSDEAGSVSDFTTSVGDYGTTEPSCYDFKGPGNGNGICVKNNAASVWNRSSQTVRVYYNSDYAGSFQDFAAGAKGNLNATLKNNNASHQFLGSGATCSTSGLGDPNTCAEAVSWAKSHETTTYHADYDGWCDHVVGLAYGWSASGSTTAYNHWLAVPSAYKHAGSRSVPAGGLAFFSGGSGHVMISIGDGQFVSNDIGGNGTLTVTTIATIESRWGKTYLGWTQPWFQVNH
ncbi:peptidase inhibitor family I36 protein [Dactylosporangium sp. NPDC051484]|uniref:peptidase inhibitor family I36 protein n=1 Tax=Dactylosporangium sp. NPDC051484 TaxID=3154942 RepID=UPI00344DE530